MDNQFLADDSDQLASTAVAGSAASTTAPPIPIANLSFDSAALPPEPIPVVPPPLPEAIEPYTAPPISYDATNIDSAVPPVTTPEPSVADYSSSTETSEPVIASSTSEPQIQPSNAPESSSLDGTESVVRTNYGLPPTSDSGVGNYQPVPVQAAPTRGNYANINTTSPLYSTNPIMSTYDSSIPAQAFHKGLTSISPKRAILVSLIITTAVVGLAGSLLAFQASRTKQANKGTVASTIPSQEIEVDSAVAALTPFELDNSGLSLLINGDAIVRGDIKLSGVNDQITTIKAADGPDLTQPATNHTITLPNGSGTVCLDTNNCAYATTAQLTALQQAIPTVGRTGVQSVRSASGNIVVTTNAAGQVTITDTTGAAPANPKVTSINGQTNGITIQGTANQIGITTGPGVLTISAAQDIATFSSPTFGGLTVAGVLASNNLTPSSALNVGSTAQNLTLQGANTTISATSGGVTNVLSFVTPAGSNKVINFPNISGTVCLDFGNCLGGGGGGGANAALSNLAAVAINTHLLTGAPGIDLGSNANPFRDLFLGSSGTTNFRLTGTATAARTLTLPDASGTFCLDSGNCPNSGANLALSNLAGVAINTSLLPGSTSIDLGNNTNPFRDLYIGGTTTNNFRLTGAATGARLITLPDVNGTVCLDSGNCLGGANGGANTALSNLNGVAINTSLLPGSAGAVDLGDINLPFGQLFVAGSSSNPAVNKFLITGASTGGTRTITLPNASGTVAVSASGNIALSVATGNLTFSGTLPIGNGGTGVISNPSNGQLLIGNGVGYNLNALTAGAGVNITNGSGTITISSPGSGTCSTCADRTLNNLTSVAINTSLLPGSTSIDLGATATPFRDLYIGSTPTNNFRFTGTATATRTLTLPDASGTVCLNSGNCLGGGSGGANTSLSNLTGVAINTSLLAGSTTIDLGSRPAPFRDLYVGGTATNNFRITGTATSAQTITLPNASGIVCLDVGNCPGVATTLQGAYTSSTGGTTPEIKLDTTRAAVDIQDSNVTIGGNLLNVRASNAVGLGNLLFGIGNTGVATFQNSANSVTAFTVNNAAGSSILGVDTSNGRVGVGTNAPRSELDVAANGAVLTIGTTGVGGHLRFGTNAITNSIQYAGAELGVYTSQSNGIRFYTNTGADTATPEVVINNSGNVGIGVTSPTGRLEVAAANQTTAGAAAQQLINFVGGSGGNGAAGTNPGGAGSSANVTTGLGGSGGTGTIGNNGGGGASGGAFTVTSGAGGAGGTGGGSGGNGGGGAVGGTLTLQAGGGGSGGSNGGGVGNGGNGASGGGIVLQGGAGGAGGTGTINGTAGSFGNIVLQSGGGNVGIGTSSPLNLLSVGASSQLQVNTSGDILTPSGENLSITTGTTGSLILDSGTNGSITLGTGTNSKAISIGNSTGSTSLSLQAGTGGILLGSAGIANTLQIGNTTGAVSQNLFIGNNSTASSTTTTVLGSSVGGSTTTIQGGTAASGAITATGTALFRTTTNSATGFQVQNAGSAQLVNVDTLYSNITLGGLNSPDLAPWSTSSNPLGSGLYNATSVTANGYLYVIGGNSGSTQTAVNYTRLNANGTTGAWTTSSSPLPAARERATSVVANGYLYVIGGFSGSTTQSTVYYAKLNSDGTTGAWTTGIALPTARERSVSITANGFMYVIGGFDGATTQSTVYYSKFNADGSFGAWQTTTALPNPREWATSVVANGYVYVLGGLDSADQSTVYYSKLNSDGTIGTWNTSPNSMPAVRERATSVAANGYVYVIGGTELTSGVQTTVFYARLNSDGTTGVWGSTSGLPTAHFGATAVINNGYIYNIGGFNAGPQSAVVYTSTARLKIGGSVDLVGLGAQSLSEGNGGSGGTGGSLTAGNTFISGQLTVTDQANLYGSAVVGKNLTVGTDANSPANLLALGVLVTNDPTSRLTVGTGSGGNKGIVIQGRADQTADLFQAQNSSGTVLASISANGTLTVNAANVNGLLTVSGHIKSTQTTPPTIGTPASCGTGASAAVTAGSTDSAGSFTISSGTGSPSTCDTTITFNVAYGGAPKAVLVSARDASSSTLQPFVLPPTTTTFTIAFSTSPAASSSNSFYYWVVE